MSDAPVRARGGMVASAEIQATQIGVETLRRGGNAVDAAVAVAFALAVTWPEAGNLGGGGFLLLRRADGFATAIDYREVAPAAARRDLFLDANGDVIRGEGGPLIGYRACGVPGTVAGLARAHRRYGSGRLSWADLIEPARQRAADGFVVSEALARSIERERPLLSRFPESQALFVGRRAGERWRQPDLAATLTRLQRHGPREFYEGETAKRIAADVQARGGLLAADDLRRYRAIERIPVSGTYRGRILLSMPPPSSGGTVLIGILQTLEGWPLARLGPDDPLRAHLLIEAMRRAFADRAEYFGDPDFIEVPVARLTDPAYAARRRLDIDLRRATPSASVRAGIVPTEPASTTHFSVVDAQGNAASNTYTLNGAFGSGVAPRGTGLLLNNEMDDFTARVGAPNLFGLIQGARNAVGPRRRPLSSMSPTLVLTPDRRLELVLGSPGGPTIISAVLQTLLNGIDHGMDIAAAVAAPRLHHQWLPDEVVWEAACPPGVRDGLAARGHRLAASARVLGEVQAIRILPDGTRTGASDPRGSGATAGTEH